VSSLVRGWSTGGSPSLESAASERSLPFAPLVVALVVPAQRHVPSMLPNQHQQPVRSAAPTPAYAHQYAQPGAAAAAAAAAAGLGSEWRSLVAGAGGGPAQQRQQAAEGVVIANNPPNNVRMSSKLRSHPAPLHVRGCLLLPPSSPPPPESTPTSPC
jgi:hypothetical protein